MKIISLSLIAGCVLLLGYFCDLSQYKYGVTVVHPHFHITKKQLKQWDSILEVDYQNYLDSLENTPFYSRIHLMPYWGNFAPPQDSVAFYFLDHGKKFDNQYTIQAFQDKLTFSDTFSRSKPRFKDTRLIKSKKIKRSENAYVIFDNRDNVKIPLGKYNNVVLFYSRIESTVKLHFGDLDTLYNGY
ncbi:MAG: hypothetical protein K1X92_01065 [Bacteroidia bacterium]|nr:hypothetical protein [Bacteroidia bacterium]